MKTWREKKKHGQFLKQLDEVGGDIKGTWNWLKKADLKSSTETLICAAQEQALRTNYVKFHVDKSVESPLCRMCHEKGESVTHVISECSKLAQKEYKKRYDNVARMIHWELCGVHGLDRADKWHEHQPQSVSETDKTKV